MESSVALQKKQSVEKAIDLYQSIVEQYNSRASRSFYLDISVMVGVPVVAAVLAGYFSNIAGILATAGVGVINIGDKLTRGRTLLTKYWSDRNTLQDTVNALRLEDVTCEMNIEKLDELLKKVMAYFAAMQKASGANQSS